MQVAHVKEGECALRPLHRCAGQMSLALGSTTNDLHHQTLWSSISLLINWASTTVWEDLCYMCKDTDLEWKLCCVFVQPPCHNWVLVHD